MIKYFNLGQPVWIINYILNDVGAKRYSLDNATYYVLIYDATVKKVLLTFYVSFPKDRPYMASVSTVHLIMVDQDHVFVNKVEAKNYCDKMNDNLMDEKIERQKENVDKHPKKAIDELLKAPVPPLIINKIGEKEK